MLKYIFGAIAIGLFWGVVLLFDLPLWIAIGGTVLVLAIVGGIALFKWWKANRAAQRLEDALTAEAARQASTARPDLQADLAEVQNEFSKAISALKNSKVGGGGRNALYALPWYVIVGPPGAGKTTALQQSGLNFPYLSREGGGIRGVGGTRNCDWWLTNDGVLIDTAGRWTSDDDRNEWLGFLDLLKRYRNRKPLNGLLVAVSVDRLGASSEAEAHELGRRVRARVDEAMNQLEMSLPVYVVFTKCDLIPGFVETFDDMSRAERSQIWGFTETIKKGGTTNPEQRFSEQWQELTSSLEQRVLRRMSEERRLERREAIFGFPQQFAAHGSRFSAFVGSLFEANVFQETPMLRGCYFVSGTQEGNPIDRVMHRMADALGVATATPQGAAGAESKSYFITELFRQVVFPDADLAVRSASEQSRQRWLNIGVSSAIAVLALAILALPAISYVRNQALVESVASAVGQFNTAAQTADERGLPAPEAFEPLHNAWAELETLEQETPVMMTFGLFQGERLLGPVEGYLATQLNQRVVSPLQETERQNLERLQQRYGANVDDVPSARVHREAYERLKTELLLSVPRDDEQPALDPELEGYLAQRMVGLWTDGDADGTSSAMPLMALYVHHLEGAPELYGQRDVAQVRQVRHILGRVAGEQIAVDGLIDRFADEQPITVRSIVGSTVPHIHGRRSVRGVFSRSVWENDIQPLLERPMGGLLGDPWVLGHTETASNEEEQAVQRERVKREYFDRYIAEWREFLRGIYSVPSRGGNHGALAQLQDLTRGEPSALHRLFATVEEHLDLTPPEPEEPEQESGALDEIERMARNRLGRTAAGRVGLAAAEDADGATAQVNHTFRVKEEFSGFSAFGMGEGDTTTGLDIYEEQLLFVRDALQTHLDDPSDPGALVSRLQQARTRTRGLISDQEVGWRPTFQALLWPPIDGASMSFSEASGLGAGRAWCTEVVSPFQRMLEHRYPFRSNGEDFSVSDFGEYFRPETGTLWAFVDSQLSDHVQRSGAEYSFKQQLGRPAASVLQPSLLRFLNHGTVLTRAFFATDDEEPAVAFDVRIRPSTSASSITFAMGEEAFEYHNGPEEWRHFEWPGEAPEQGASLAFRGSELQEQLEQGGEWGLFRLIEQGSVTSRSGERFFSVTWRFDTHDTEITIDFRPSRSENPFFVQGDPRQSIFSLLRDSQTAPPREIVTERRVCPRR